MNDMVAIKSSKLPAHLQGKAKTSNFFGAAVTVGGFPVVSIKGKVFHIQRGDERTLVTKPDSDDEPAAALEVVILSANPNKSKVYYAHGYEQGSVAKPTCYSNDGTGPAADAEEPQSKKCAICPHNQWGSRVTDNGGKGKACGDSMRLAIAPAGQVNDPMLLRVPAATLKTLGQYGAQLAKRGVEPHHVITKISFDYNVAHPALTFKATRFVEADELEEVEAALADEAEVIAQITGVSESNTIAIEHVADSETKTKPAKPVKAAVKVEETAEVEEAPAPKKKKTVTIEEHDNIDDALDNLDFDD
jgi:hypothetical protein